MRRDTAYAAIFLSSWVIACRGAGSEDPDPSGGGSKVEQGPPVSYGPGTLTAAKYGYFPNTVSVDDAQAAYEDFRSRYAVDCGEHGLRIASDASSETLSEGIGQGALLAVGWNDQATFNGLYSYYQHAAGHTDAKKGVTHGLMGWRIWGDACVFQEVEPGAAAAADLNMAMALLQAECQWGGSSYYYGGLAIMNAIHEYMTAQVPEGIVQLPSDMGDAPGCMNASYSAPAFYRVFAKAQPEQADFWNRMADDAYVFLNQASNETTGLVPDWAPIGASACTEATPYVGYDAIRTHWRASTDYAWFQAQAAQDWLKHVTIWVDTTVGSDHALDMQDGFFDDGSEILGPAAQGNSAFLGAIAVGTMPVSGELSDKYHEVFKNVPAVNDDSYYTVTARALYLLLSVTKFSPGCYE